MPRKKIQGTMSFVSRMRWLEVGSVFVMAVIVLGSVQFSKYELVGTDSFYHTSVAELIKNDGLIESLPWVSASVYADKYADTEFLFHTMLIPFLGKKKRMGPKILTVLLSSLILALLAWVMIRNGLAWSWLWMAIILGAGVALTFRLNLTRPHLLSLLLTILFVHFLLSKNTFGLFIVSAIFPLAYVAAHLLIILAVIYLASCLLMRQHPPWTVVLVVILGIAVGIAINPYRAHWAYIWWILNVGDLSSIVLDAAVPVREFAPPEFVDVVLGTGLVLPVFVAANAALIIKMVRPSTRTIFVSLVAWAFFILYLLYQRFVIYWVPFSMLSTASIFTELNVHTSLAGWANRRRRWSLLLFSLGLMLLSGQMVRSMVMSQKSIASENTPRYTHAAQWLDHHVPAAATVFTCQWDSTPFLIYKAPGLRYLNVLSPNFMIAHDKDLYETWLSIRDGAAPDPLKSIVQRFDSSWLLVEKDKTPEKLFHKAIRGHAKLEYEDYESAVFKLLLQP